MKSNVLSSTILMGMLCLSAMSQQFSGQQHPSSFVQSSHTADASGESGSGNLVAQGPRRKGFGLMSLSRNANPNAARPSSVMMANALPSVHGAGTVGKIALWAGIRPNGESILGDSIITQSNNNIGIGLATPSSKLSVQGIIEATLGGYKFPDGTIQTTAAISGLQLVSHDSTLMGLGTSDSPLGVAVPLVLTGSSFSNPVLAVTNTAAGGGVGIFGQNDSGAGVQGQSVDGFGVSGSSRDADGVNGFSRSSDMFRAGVSGHCENCNGLFGRGAVGVKGFAPESVDGVGVLGTGNVGVKGEGSDRLSQAGGLGVEAKGGHSIDSGGGNGIFATGGDSDNSTGGNGVVAAGGNFNGRGVVATGGTGPAGYGVEAKGGPSAGPSSVAGAGVFATGGPANTPNSASGTGILAVAGEATGGATRGRAGIFQGDVSVEGSITAGAIDVSGTKNFKIDHPLDPANKYLLHASIESSEVLNVYSGNVTTDGKGEAVVTLPAWFESVNRDFRYQLTTIGTFAQTIIAEEVKNSRFTIRTSLPNVRVSWQVTGVRSDRAMTTHPFKAEQDKSEKERGHYLQPHLYGQPAEQSVEWARDPELKKQLHQQRRTKKSDD